LKEETISNANEKKVHSPPRTVDQHVREEGRDSPEWFGGFWATEGTKNPTSVTEKKKVEHLPSKKGADVSR